MAPQGLAPRKLLPLNGSNEIKDGGQQQKHRRSNQAGPPQKDAKPLHQTHDAVHARTHRIGREAAHEFVEAWGGRADAQQEGDLEEDEDEAGDSARWRGLVSEGREEREKEGGKWEVYRHIMLKIMRREKLKMLAMPRARQRIMQRTPVLVGGRC